MTARLHYGITRSRLERAVTSGALFLVYQPKLDLRSNEIAGVEALARWEHPRLGAISPSAFIPAAEREGLIDWFTEWALGHALRQWSQWHGVGLDLELAVNISALNLRHVQFPDHVSRMCADHGVPPRRLVLELTESATQEATLLMDTVSRCRLKGLSISLDDFGTGYGSLIHLRSLPFTELKIDQRFVSDLSSSRDSIAITRGLIAIAHDMGLTVTAEGVEDLETLQILRAFGCDKAQGFLISPPLAGDRLAKFVQTWTAAERKGAENRAGGEKPVYLGHNEPSETKPARAIVGTDHQQSISVTGPRPSNMLAGRVSGP